MNNVDDHAWLIIGIAFLVAITVLSHQYMTQWYCIHKASFSEEMTPKEYHTRIIQCL